MFLNSFRIQYFNTLVKTVNETFKYIESNFTTNLHSYGQIGIGNSSMSTSRLGTCATNVYFLGSTVDTVGRGCSADTGLGKGVYKDGCAASGGSQAGPGGYGAKDKADPQNPDCSRI